MKKILTYGVVFNGKGGDQGGSSPGEAFKTRALKFGEIVKDGFVKLETFREQHRADLEQGADIVNREKPLYVFAAPEWFFRVKEHQIKFDENEYFSAAERQSYLELLASLSTKADADLLMVAGSMLWIDKKSELTVNKVKEETDKYVEGKAKKYQEKVRSSQRLAEEERVLKDRRELITSGKRYLGYNEAFAFFNGVQKKRLLKSFNSNDFMMNGRLLDAPGQQVDMVYGLGAGVFTLEIGGGRLKVGLAICYDHSRVRNYDKHVDLYILISCSQDLKSEKYVKDGGLILHSDCCLSWSDAKAGENNKSMKHKYTGKYLLAGALIEIE